MLAFYAVLSVLLLLLFFVVLAAVVKIGIREYFREKRAHLTALLRNADSVGKDRQFSNRKEREK